MKPRGCCEVPPQPLVVALLASLVVEGEGCVLPHRHPDQASHGCRSCSSVVILPQPLGPLSCFSLSSNHLRDEDNTKEGGGHRQKLLRAAGLHSPAVEAAEFPRHLWEGFRLSKAKTQLRSDLPAFVREEGLGAGPPLQPWTCLPTPPPFLCPGGPWVCCRVGRVE